MTHLHESWFGDTPQYRKRTAGLIAMFILVSPLILAVEVMLLLGPGCRAKKRK